MCDIQGGSLTHVEGYGAFCSRKFIYECGTGFIFFSCQICIYQRADSLAYACFGAS